MAPPVRQDTPRLKFQFRHLDRAKRHAALRIIFDELNALRAGESSVQRLNAVSKGIAQVLQASSLEVQYAKWALKAHELLAPDDEDT